MLVSLSFWVVCPRNPRALVLMVAGETQQRGTCERRLDRVANFGEMLIVP